MSTVTLVRGAKDEGPTGHGQRLRGRSGRASRHQAEQPTERIFAARVTEASAAKRSCRIATVEDGAEMLARTADSCLLDPARGDLVLCSRCVTEAGLECFILSVLARADLAVSARMTVPGGLSLYAGEGPLELHTAGSLSLRAGDSAHLTAGTLDVAASTGSFRLDSSVVEGQTALVRIGTLQVMGDRLVSLIKAVMGRHLRASRKVEEADELQAGSITMNAENTLKQQGRHILHISTEDMRLDGARIHMG